MQKKLHFSRCVSPLRWCALLLALATLAGCAYAPGLSMRKGLEAQQAALNSGAKPAQQAGSAGAPHDAPPAGALLSITSELILAQRAAQPVEVSPEVRRLFGVAKPYQIGAGDVLNIVVWDHPELVLLPAGSTIATDASSLSPVGNGYNVSSAGYIQFPYVGSVKLGGLTEFEARDVLVQQLSKYVKGPRITLRIQAYRSSRVYVDGEVRIPGLLAINDIPMTLPEVINRAGGLTASADRSSVTVSRGGKTTLIDMQQLTELGVNPSRILLSKDDVLRVHSKEDSKVYVLGEVTRPLALPLLNGRLTLNEALGEAGGISVTGDPKQVYVVRAQADGKSEIYHLDASSPMAYALSQGFVLKSRDVVYVDPAPVVQWNRVISQILPSAQAVNASASATR